MRARPRCLAFALIAASACGTAEPVAEPIAVAGSDGVPVTETVPASVHTSETDTDIGAETNETAPDTNTETDTHALPVSSASGSHPLASVEPDVVLAVRDLGRGRARHDFEVPIACPLARVELDLEVESMPDGLVTLRTPSGREARLGLHVLTTTHFVRTWDWAMLDDLHAARGEPSHGTWTLEVRARGAMYQGGAQPHSSPMPEPIYPSAALRVYCEPEHAPAAPGSELRVEVEVATAPRRPGAGVHA
ncbi:MAG: proprotein convertase P-domain-containing protein, partial [Deltaproteobacteria bacterium]|nr:proprotein convertase P-domain-containing protein [Deltaproteobacteria bacterium]